MADDTMNQLMIEEGVLLGQHKEIERLRAENAQLLARLQAPLPEEVTHLREMLTSYAPDPEEEAEIAALLERLAHSAREVPPSEETATLLKKLNTVVHNHGDDPFVPSAKNAAPQVAAQATSAPQSRVQHPGPAVAAPCIEPEMVTIPAGSFLMGSPENESGRFSDEGPQHCVTFARPFECGKYPITFGEWDAYVAAGGTNYSPSDNGWGRGRRPVINVSWDGAQGYIRWLNAQTGKSYRLLTEAEWEYCCRAGTTTAYNTGDEISTKWANFDSVKTMPVGSYYSNSFGLFDMHGNVWEWVEDCWYKNYKDAPTDGSALISDDCSQCVYRGGGWSSEPRFVRSANRVGFTSGYRGRGLGFRLARTLESPPDSSRLNLDLAAPQVVATETPVNQSGGTVPAGAVISLHDDPDGKRWAEEFNTTLVRLGHQPLDAGWLLSWFANAIMCGHDSALRGLDEPSDAAVVLARNVLEGATAESWALDHARELAREIIRWRWHEGRKS